MNVWKAKTGAVYGSLRETAPAVRILLKPIPSIGVTAGTATLIINRVNYYTNVIIKIYTNIKYVILHGAWTVFYVHVTILLHVVRDNRSIAWPCMHSEPSFGISISFQRSAAFYIEHRMGCGLVLQNYNVLIK